MKSVILKGNNGRLKLTYIHNIRIIVAIDVALISFLLGKSGMSLLYVCMYVRYGVSLPHQHNYFEPTTACIIVCMSSYSPEIEEYVCMYVCMCVCGPRRCQRVMIDDLTYCNNVCMNTCSTHNHMMTPLYYMYVCRYISLYVCMYVCMYTCMYSCEASHLGLCCLP